MSLCLRSARVGRVLTLVDSLKVVGEPTRLRILVILDDCEATTTEICHILGQTQPRVSRHLKLLADQGLVVRRADGARAFYQSIPVGQGHDVVQAVLGLVDPDDPQIVADRARLEQVRHERIEQAADYFSSVADDWDQIRALHVADSDVEQALLAAVPAKRFSSLLDIGTGTARVMELFADRAKLAVGVDNNSDMLNVARTNLDKPGLRHCSVRKSSAYALDVESDSVDVAVIHHVLHFLEDVPTVFGEAYRVLRSGGQLLVVDFSRHAIERLRDDYNHRRLGFANDEMEQLLSEAGFTSMTTTSFSPDEPIEEKLTVTLWSAYTAADDFVADGNRLLEGAT